MEINRITAAIVIPVVYLLILAKRYVDAKASESEISTDLNSKIKSILEKVSD